MPVEKSKDVALSVSDSLIPILIIEELVRSDRPMSVGDINKTIGIAMSTLKGHISVLVEEGFIEAYGSPTTLMISKRLVRLSTKVLSM